PSEATCGDDENGVPRVTPRYYAGAPVAGTLLRRAMSRRRFLVYARRDTTTNRAPMAAVLKSLLAVAVVGPSLMAGAQTASTTYRVGWLSHGNAPSQADASVGEFRLALKELGYVEGRNIVIESRYAGDTVDRLNQLAGELVALKADVIVTSGEAAALA